MDLAANQPDRRPPSPDAIDRSDAPVDDEITLVPATVEGRMVINVSDVESYGLERRLLGDSSDENSDNDDEGVTYGVEMPSAPGALSHGGGCSLCYQVLGTTVLK